MNMSGVQQWPGQYHLEADAPLVASYVKVPTGHPPPV
jgi:hypothetical protein